MSGETLELFQGVTYPAIEAQVAHWIPKNQRATAVSLIHTGGFFGVAIGMYISGVLSASEFWGGWPAVFYVFGKCRNFSLFKKM